MIMTALKNALRPTIMVLKHARSVVAAAGASIPTPMIVLAAFTLAACNGGTPARETTNKNAGTNAPRMPGVIYTVADTTVSATYDADGIAEPIQQASLSTKLMGTVTAVLVHEGDIVTTGQPLLRIDARELSAKASRVAAAIADAEAMQLEAATHASRFRALYADSAATRAQFDAAESGLARANAGVSAARAAASELDAMSSYATVRAPFAGIVTHRMADPGMFAAPGAPLLTVQDGSSLRISASAAADAVRALKRGESIDAVIDGAPVSARIEGIVPSGAGNLFTINAIVDNRAGRYRAGSAATLRVGQGTQHALVVPLAAIVHDGDLTGVIVRGAQGDERRWVRLGTTIGSGVEVTSGLRAGEKIVVPTPGA
jgi:RND family efflux transporter MFP subunit